MKGTSELERVCKVVKTRRRRKGEVPRDNRWSEGGSVVEWVRGIVGSVSIRCRE